VWEESHGAAGPTASRPVRDSLVQGIHRNPDPLNFYDLSKPTNAPVLLSG